MLRAQAVYAPYPVPYAAEAPAMAAPEGYKPVYISHFSRHGSRYLLKRYADAGNELCKLHPDDSVWQAVKAVYAMHAGRKGTLSVLGAKEQQGIGRRMAERFPELFSGGQVRAKASMAGRCKESMRNCLKGLESIVPGLKSKTSSDVFTYLRYSKGVKNEAQSMRKDPGRILWHYGSVVRLIGLDKDFITRYLTDEEWAAMQAGGEGYYHEKLLPKTLQDASVSRPLLKDIVSQADAALDGKGRYVADLRFGHDSAFVPLCALMGIKGFCLWEGEAGRISDLVPMAANIQLIFYRNDAGNVIVKILHNESETTIPDLTPIEYKNSGLFYSWPELKSYLKSR